MRRHSVRKRIALLAGIAVLVVAGAGTALAQLGLDQPTSMSGAGEMATRTADHRPAVGLASTPVSDRAPVLDAVPFDPPLPFPKPIPVPADPPKPVPRPKPIPPPVDPPLPEPKPIPLPVDPPVPDRKPIDPGPIHPGICPPHPTIAESGIAGGWLVICPVPVPRPCPIPPIDFVPVPPYPCEWPRNPWPCPPPGDIVLAPRQLDHLTLWPCREPPPWPCPPPAFPDQVAGPNEVRVWWPCRHPVPIDPPFPGPAPIPLPTPILPTPIPNGSPDDKGPTGPVVSQVRELIQQGLISP